MKLAFIGGGVMGEAMISAVLKNGLAKPQDVAVCDLLSQRRAYLTSTYKIKALDKPAPVLEGADIAVLAVKPQEFSMAAGSLSIKSGQTVMSIMAGVTIATIQDALKHDASVRAIPNTPAPTATSSTPASTRRSSAEARACMRSVRRSVCSSASPSPSRSSDTPPRASWTCTWASAVPYWASGSSWRAER